MDIQTTSPIKKLSFGQTELNWKLIGGLILIILAGVGSGYGVSRLRFFSKSISGGQKARQVAKGEKVKVGQTYGQKDKIFSDEAIGIIEKNTQKGEGTHKLLREGGESQTAYLTSSLVDLDRFINRKVKVWGETFAAQKVGWLMDVGAVKVLE